MKSDVDNEFNKKYKVHLGNYVDADENTCVPDSHSILVEIVQTTCQTVTNNYEQELWVCMTCSDPYYMFFKFMEINSTMMEVSIGDENYSCNCVSFVLTIFRLLFGNSCYSVVMKTF